jgi:hypothetical protein
MYIEVEIVIYNGINKLMLNYLSNAIRISLKACVLQDKVLVILHSYNLDWS